MAIARNVLGTFVAVLVGAAALAGCDPQAPAGSSFSTSLSPTTTTTTTTQPVTTGPASTTVTTTAITTTAPPAPVVTTQAQVERTTPAVAAPPNPGAACGSDSYVNSDGNCIHRPTAAPGPPAGATAHCKDGTYSFSAHRSGTCSGHGGVAQWL